MVAMSSVKIVVTFSVLGRPQPKQRPRLGIGGRVYTPAATKAYERNVALAYLVASNGFKRASYLGEIELYIRCDVRGVARSDLDNVVKCICDGLNGIAYADDAQVSRIVAERRQVSDKREEQALVEVTYP